MRMPADNDPIEQLLFSKIWQFTRRSESLRENWHTFSRRRERRISPYRGDCSRQKKSWRNWKERRRAVGRISVDTAKVRKAHLRKRNQNTPTDISNKILQRGMTTSIK